MRPHSALSACLAVILHGGGTLLVALALVGCGSPSESEPTPTATATPLLTPSPTFTPSPSPPPTREPTPYPWTRDGALCYLDALDRVWRQAVQRMIPVLDAIAAGRDPAPSTLQAAADALEPVAAWYITDAGACTPAAAISSPECAGDATWTVIVAAGVANSLVLRAGFTSADWLRENAQEIGVELIKANNAMAAAWAACTTAR